MTHRDLVDAARSHGLDVHPVSHPFVQPDAMLDGCVIDEQGVSMHVGLVVAGDEGGASASFFVFAPLVLDITESADRQGLRLESPAGVVTVGRFAGLVPALRPAGTLQAGIVHQIDATESITAGRWDLVYDALKTAVGQVAREARRLTPRIIEQHGGRAMTADPVASKPAAPTRTSPGAAPVERSGPTPAADPPPDRLGTATGRFRRQRYRATVLWIPYSVLLVLGVLEHVIGGPDSPGHRDLRIEYVDGQVVVSTDQTISTGVMVAFVMWLAITTGLAWALTKRREVGARSFGENVSLYLARPGRIVIVGLVDLLIVMLPRLAIAMGLAAGLSLLMVAESLPRSYRWGNQHGGGFKWTPARWGYAAVGLAVLVLVTVVVVTELAALAAPVWGPPGAAWQAFGAEPPGRGTSFLIGLAFIAFPLVNEIGLLRSRLTGRRGAP